MRVVVVAGKETFCPNNKLSHRHFLGNKLSQMTKCPTFSPCDKLSQRQNVPFPPRRQNVPLMILLKNHCFTGIFRATNCPKVTKCPTFSPATKCPNLCTYAHESYGKLLGHFVASEKGYWDMIWYVQYMFAKCANFAQGVRHQINNVGQPTKCPNNFP